MLNHSCSPHIPNRVVVMGGNGFVGGAIVRVLTARNIPVLSLSRTEVDLTAFDAVDTLARLLRPEDSFVAVSAVAPVKNLDMLCTNVTMLNAMVGALRKRPVAHIVNIGSDAVFGDDLLPLTEISPKAPTALHGIMHAAREIAFSELPIPQATLRPTLIYGHLDPHNGYGPNRFRRLANEGRDITLFGEGEERRDHVFVDDVADLALRILACRSTGSLNAVTGQVWSFREIASMVVGMMKVPVRIVSSHRNGPMPHNGYRAFDNSATFEAFPDFQYTALPAGLAHVQRETGTDYHAGG